jgi:hypothetical protein
MGKSIVHSKENDHDSSHKNIKVEKGKNKILWKISKHKRDPTGFNIMHLHWGYLLQGRAFLVPKHNLVVAKARIILQLNKRQL